MKKITEKSDKYSLTKYNLTEEQLAGYKKQKEEIGDPDLIIEDLLESEMTVGLSTSAKINYLAKLRKKVITILFLIEQYEENPELVDKILNEGTAKAREKATEQLKKVKHAMKIDY